ncbi:MAG: 6-bladed beta-propeller [Gemmatimonadota bacterium]|nr:6-bladed beta-propeller [Gemmatimonadota bacterium]
MRAASTASLVLAATTVLACTGDDAREGAPVVTRDTVGDTLVVRTESGSLWGAARDLAPTASIGVLEGDDAYMFGSVSSIGVTADGRILVLDNQVPILRMFGPDGAHIRDVGSAGEGPGEYESPDGGMSVLPDGRIAVRDPGTGKIVVFDSQGDHLDDWRLPYGGGFSTSEGFYVDSESLLTMTITNLGAPVTEWVRGYIRFSHDGTVRDTLFAPGWDFEEWRVSGQSENSSSSTGVPFAPDTNVYYSPLGYFVGGLSTDYRIELFKPDGILRIERAWDPVPVNSEEASARRRSIEESFRERFQGWSWNGPDIPDTKPPYSGLFVAEDGRIWVVVATPSEEFMSLAEAAEEERATGRAPNRFRAPVAFDVFEPDGRYLGRVNAPTGFSLSPRPVFRGETVWAVTRDEFDVPRVTRFELVPND